MTRSGAPPTIAPHVVVDTNIHLAACISRSDTSPTREVIHRGCFDQFVFSLSGKLLMEMHRKLIDAGFHESDVGAYLAQVIRHGQAFADELPAGVWCRDATDTFLLMLAKVSDAWRLVSCDRDLLDENAVRPAGLVCRRPVPFLKEIRELRNEDTLAFLSEGADFPPPAAIGR